MTQLYAQPSQQGIWMALGPPQSAAFALGQSLTLTYGDGTQDTLAAHVPAVTSAGTTQVDRTGAVWLLYVVAGDPTLRIVREMDQATIAGSYAPLARVLADRVVPYQPDNGQAQSSTSGQSFLPLSVTNTSSTQSIGGSTPVPVAIGSTDYVVQCHLSGTTATAVWNALSDKTSASDLQVIFAGAEIDADIDQQTNGAWSSSNQTLWFRLQRPIAASSTDQGYQLRMGGGLRSSPPRSWANIYPFGDDFVGTSLSSSWATTGSPSLSVAGSILALANNGVNNNTQYVTSTLAVATGYETAAWATIGPTADVQTQLDLQLRDVLGPPANEARLYSAGGSLLAENGNSAGTSSATLGTASSSYQRYTIARSASGAVTYGVAGSLTSLATNTSAAALPIWLEAYFAGTGAGTGATLSLDWIKVRPWISSEPSVSAGTLQSAGALVWQPITDSTGSVLVDSAGNPIMALSSL